MLSTWLESFNAWKTNLNGEAGGNSHYHYDYYQLIHIIQRCAFLFSDPTPSSARFKWPAIYRMQNVQQGKIKYLYISEGLSIKTQFNYTTLHLWNQVVPPLLMPLGSDAFSVLPFCSFFKASFFMTFLSRYLWKIACVKRWEQILFRLRSRPLKYNRQHTILNQSLENCRHLIITITHLKKVVRPSSTFSPGKPLIYNMIRWTIYQRLIKLKIKILIFG